jgi:hypothetical protein
VSPILDPGRPMPILSKTTAMDIALSHREIETAEGLLAELRKTLTASAPPTDLRDVFGRPQNALQLGIPSGQGGHRLFEVPFSLAIPVIEAHIAHHRARLTALTEKARFELGPICFGIDTAADEGPQP